MQKIFLFTLKITLAKCVLSFKKFLVFYYKKAKKKRSLWVEILFLNNLSIII